MMRMAAGHPVAIGSPVDQCEGVQTVTKRENPKWFSSDPMGDGRAAGRDAGPAKSARPRALYLDLGEPLHRIHGTDRPRPIGGAVSMERLRPVPTCCHEPVVRASSPIPLQQNQAR